MAGQPKRRKQREAAAGGKRPAAGQRWRDISDDEREANKAAAEAELEAAFGGDTACNADPAVVEARDLARRGEPLFPVIPADVARGLDVAWAESGADVDPRSHKFTAGALGDGDAACEAVYWTPERRAAAANEVALRLARGEALGAILGPGRDHAQLPGRPTFMRWIFGVGDEYVRRAYMLGRQMQAEGYADEMVALADGATDADGDMAAVQGRRLAIETRQFIMAKMLPRLYGRAADGSPGVTINISTNLGGADAGDDDGAYRVVATTGDADGAAS